jgi:phage replication-related protein YjqB (UPF0714/DUF867 family)
MIDACSYADFADLARHERRGRDYEISISRNPASAVAILAPHGGRIEVGTSAIARAIAGSNYNLYLFEGIRRSHNYERLHLTSRLFDEPECLALLADCSVVVTVHGCKGNEDRVLLGGLDRKLKQRLASSLAAAGIARQADGHAFPATDPNNICNRGRTRRGVQLEISGSLRRSAFTARLADAVRAVLSECDGAPGD